MRKQDGLFLLGVTALFSPFFISDRVLAFYERTNIDHGVLLSFLKFAVLATMGEVIALRIKTGKYYQPGFGLLARAAIWGILGVAIKIAFAVFAVGVPAFLCSMGVAVTPEVMKGGLTGLKLLGAFSISLVMNLIFSPVLMTTHKMTDEHIHQIGGRLRHLLWTMRPGEILVSLNWSVMWGFVFKKTIPLFWIPAHTITFLLPPQHQILFAAILGVVLGVFMAVASMKSRPKASEAAR